MSPIKRVPTGLYDDLIDDLSGLLESARRAAARSVNSVITATYWEVGRRIVEYEQGGADRAEYGGRVVPRLARDLTERFGRGFGVANLSQMRKFYLTWPGEEIFQTPSEKSAGGAMAERFRLPWSHYVRLLSVSSPQARSFYETEALRGGWSTRQLERQITSSYYERTVLSKDKAAMLSRGAPPETPATRASDEFRDPLVLEFLGLKDEYSESDLEEALIMHLEGFLLELGGDFAFIARQRRLRVGAAWFRIDLLFFHRRLRCLVVIDLKQGEFTAADAGQMNLYLAYAREHWTHPDENPPVGLALASAKDDAVARYALDGLEDAILAREYRLVLPGERTLAEEIARVRRRVEK